MSSEDKCKSQKCLLSSPSFLISLHFIFYEMGSMSFQENKTFCRFKGSFQTLVSTQAHQKQSFAITPFCKNYYVTNVTQGRCTIMDIFVLCRFKRIIGIGFFCLFITIIHFQQEKKLQQQNVKIENGPFKSSQSHFHPTKISCTAYLKRKW